MTTPAPAPTVEVPEPVAPERVERRRGTGRGQVLLGAVGLIAPALLALLAVSLYPVLRSLWLSTRSATLARPSGDAVGLDNYRDLLADDQFWNAWRQTIGFTVSSTVLETLIGLGMALVLYESFRGRGWVRAAVLIPWAIPTVVTSRMFGWIFDGEYGVVNHILTALPFVDSNVNFLADTRFAMPTIVLADVWKTAPFMALLILAGLHTIAPSLTEAARVDGASAWQAFWRIRLPLLLPTMLIAAMLRALDAFRVFDLPYVLTGGGPADSTETLSTFGYKQLFSANAIGYGSAITTAMVLTEVAIAVGFAVFIARRFKAVGS